MDSERFSMTASRRRAMKEKDEKKRKQAAKGTPAVSLNRTLKKCGAATAPTERKTRLVKNRLPSPKTLFAGLLSRSHNESDGLPLDTSASSRNLPRGKLHWTYAQLERCLETKAEPLAWILQLIMREIWKK